MGAFSFWQLLVAGGGVGVGRSRAIAARRLASVSVGRLLVARTRMLVAWRAVARLAVARRSVAWWAIARRAVAGRLVAGVARRAVAWWAIARSLVAWRAVAGVAWRAVARSAVARSLVAGVARWAVAWWAVARRLVAGSAVGGRRWVARGACSVGRVNWCQGERLHRTHLVLAVALLVSIAWTARLINRVARVSAVGVEAVSAVEGRLDGVGMVWAVAARRLVGRCGRVRVR